VRRTARPGSVPGPRALHVVSRGGAAGRRERHRPESPARGLAVGHRRRSARARL
jgi:hypothetical protein